jgi:hypothetical protein
VPFWIARFSRELKSKAALSTRRFKAGLHFPALNQISPLKESPVVSQFEISTRSRFRKRSVFQWLMLDAVAALSH